MTRDEVEEAVRIAFAKLRHPSPDFRFDRTPLGDATPYVVGEGPEFDWVISERGIERERATMDGEELLFTAIENMTCALARREELNTRTTRKAPIWRKAKTCVDDDYSRQTWMEGHERLMQFLRQDWGARVHMKYQDILRVYPLTPQERRNARRLDLRAFGVLD